MSSDFPPLEQPHVEKTFFLKKHFFGYFFIFAVLGSFGIGYGIGSQKIQSLGAGEKNSNAFQNPFQSFGLKSQDFDSELFWDVWKRVQHNYIIKETPDKKLFYGAVAGIVNSLGDPYSIFFDPETSKKFDESLSGEFDGIGAEIGAKKGGQIVVISPLPDTPAERAGLRPGDAITSINKKTTAGMSVDEAVSLIRGKKATAVTLMIFRTGESKEREISIVRDHMVVPSVTWSVKNGNVGYIKLSQFNQDTDRLFRDAVNDLLAKNVGSVILDMRNDPGGFLDTAIQVAGYWVDKQTVVIEKYDETKKEEYKSQSRPLLQGMRTVVMINEGSASASEIVAGALQDYGKAILVGKKSFGKGSVQDLQHLKGGASLKLTIAKWLTPKGRSIQDEGIKPDVEVEQKDEEVAKGKDPQLEKAFELLKK